MDDVRLILGDSLAVLPTLESASVDACVTDPPYDLTAASRNGSSRVPGTGPFGRHRIGTKGGGFMGKEWDGTGIAFRPETWAAVLRVLKPGAYLLAFGGTRTWHRLACAIEDAGFVLQDTLCWLYGSGFPKHRSKLKPAWEPILMAWKPGQYATPLPGLDGCRIEGVGNKTFERTPGSRSREQYRTGTTSGAAIPTTVGRWPANLVLSHLPECRRVGTKRVKGTGEVTQGGMTRFTQDGANHPRRGRYVGQAGPDGKEEVEAWECARDPETGECLCPVALLDEQAGERGGGGSYRMTVKNEGRADESQYRIKPTAGTVRDHGDSGGPSRFFYCPKASRADREEGLEELPERAHGMSSGAQSHGEGYDKGQGIGLNRVRRVRNHHPTVKPHDLMRWLCRLITPPGGVILDPFMGSGSTGKAALAEGFGFIGVERDPAYFAIAENRLAATRAATPLFAQEAV